jgi:hypothetical protein
MLEHIVNIFLHIEYVSMDMSFTYFTEVYYYELIKFCLYSMLLLLSFEFCNSYYYNIKERRRV